MELAITTSNGTAGSNTLSVSDEVFGREFSRDLVHQVQALRGAAGVGVALGARHARGSLPQ